MWFSYRLWGRAVGLLKPSGRNAIGIKRVVNYWANLQWDTCSRRFWENGRDDFGIFFTMKRQDNQLVWGSWVAERTETMTLWLILWLTGPGLAPRYFCGGRDHGVYRKPRSGQRRDKRDVQPRLWASWTPTGKPCPGFLRSWKTWKSHGILKWLFPGLEKFLKKLNHKSFGKVMEICYIHMFIHAEFEKKERSLNYKQAIFVGHSNSSWGIIHDHVYNPDFTTCLVMEIWFKVMEKSWKSIGQNVYEPCLWDFRTRLSSSETFSIMTIRAGQNQHP